VCSRLAALWLFSSRRKALILLERYDAAFALPNVRVQPRAAAWCLAREAHHVPLRFAGQVPCR
jgi:hypothetical protein